MEYKPIRQYEIKYKCILSFGLVGCLDEFNFNIDVSLFIAFGLKGNYTTSVFCLFCGGGAYLKKEYLLIILNLWSKI